MEDLTDLSDPDPPAEARLLYAPHRDDRTFFNPWAPQGPRLRDVLRWWRSPNPYAAAKRRPLRVSVAPHDGVRLGARPEEAR